MYKYSVCISLCSTIHQQKTLFSLRGKASIIWFTFISIGMCWLIASYLTWGVGPEIMVSNEQVLVDNSDEFLRFSLVAIVQGITFVFYSGTLVPVKAYTPFARAFTSSGYTT
jgi:hypothetical protein